MAAPKDVTAQGGECEQVGSRAVFEGSVGVREGLGKLAVQSCCG